MSHSCRITYLITAYNDPKHLGHLLKELLRSSEKIFVHVDANVDIAPFLAASPKSDNIHFVDKRIKVRWMGFSQVESLLELLRIAVSEGFNHYVLLSGSDYPIKRSDYIREFYNVKDKDYICFWKLSDRPSWRYKVLYYFPIDLVRIREWSKGIESSYCRRLFWGRFFRYMKYFPKRRFLDGMEAYGGSDWFSISHNSVVCIFEYLAKNPKYLQFFSYAHCPSEMFFQTILLNSPRAHNAHGYKEYSEWSKSTPREVKLQEACMIPESFFNYRYYDWSDGREKPAFLDERDFANLLSSSALYARKFSSDRSAQLRDRIDREILS